MSGCGALLASWEDWLTGSEAWLAGWLRGMGVWGGASGASADAPGVGLELVSVLKYPEKR